MKKIKVVLQKRLDEVMEKAYKYTLRFFRLPY